MIARHSWMLWGYHITKLPVGPDFGFERDGKTIWVEAISPEPKGLPEHWMTRPKADEFKVGDFPHNEILLRWTRAAIKEKWQKLLDCQQKKIVAGSDAYVIALNGCQLGALPVNHGITRYPFAVEAVYPVGPLAYEVDRVTGRIGNAIVTQRLSIKNKNNAPVATTVFIDLAYAGISAVVACTMDRSDEAVLPLDIIHNHFANVSMPRGILGSAGDEWVTDPVGNAGQEIDLRKLERATSP